MTFLSRRLVLIATGGASALALSACTGQTQDELSADVTLLVNGLKAIVPTLTGLPASSQPSASVLAQIQNALDDLASNAANVGNALAPNSDSLQAISNVVSTLSALVSPFFPLSSVVNSIFQAAWAILPVILSFTKPPVPVPASAKPGGMSLDQAKLVLGAAPIMAAKRRP